MDIDIQTYIHRYSKEERKIKIKKEQKEKFKIKKGRLATASVEYGKSKDFRADYQHGGQVTAEKMMLPAESQGSLLEELHLHG